MPTYAQLATEPVWGAQFTPPTMNAGLLGPLRVFYGLGPTSVGAAGDNNHLYGRHRSYDWDRVSRYCTNRNYGTVDGRDQGGNRNWYRAVDVGITGQTLINASRRMDAWVRSGTAPGIAEWFGTFNGQTVAGWYEGRPATSDSSHLYHLHVGFWNQYADNAAVMQQTYAVITGQGALPEEDDMAFLIREPATGGVWVANYVFRRAVTTQEEWDGLRAQGVVDKGNMPPGYSIEWYGKWIESMTSSVSISPAQLEEIEQAAREGAEAGADAPTATEIADAVVDEEHRRLAE